LVFLATFLGSKIFGGGLDPRVKHNVTVAVQIAGERTVGEFCSLNNYNGAPHDGYCYAMYGAAQMQLAAIFKALVIGAFERVQCCI